MSNPNHASPASPRDLYDSKPPWDIDRPQPAFARLASAGTFSGRVLDIGCGTGEHALLAAGLGLEATGVDQSVRALGHAERKARERGIEARFLHHDALALAELGETFDTVLDCGLFHIFPPETRSAYAQSLAAVLSPGGQYFMLGFSDKQPGDWGPHRLTRTDIETAFADGWRIDSLAPAVIDIRTDPAGVAAWLAAITRK
ncbi:SAM-dependent methyltransferase [Nocardia sp. 852002-20019_SCH5090214]|uniref:class I SAM-dependent methyltransferase n=1 Tax=Nocardia TaxID=1817 RepID=UPI0007A49AC6|nr:MULTISPECIES: class I SAM-dependent methyltransferase [Nocardia]MCC3316740.1 class I SAM-dependent methyltransferase [Nocardia africana]OBA50940.1 SAM-dependent methyltransferase [Nocardia sp. 852002-20019_SCH5090214]